MKVDGLFAAWLLLLTSLVPIDANWESQVDGFVVEQVATKACDTCKEEDFRPVHLTKLKDKLIFAAGGGDGFVVGNELFISDGTTAGTQLVTQINTNSTERGATPRRLVPLGDDKIIFSADDVVHGREPWVTDGTAEGTELLLDIVAGEDLFGWNTFNGRPVELNGKLYFPESRSFAPLQGVWVTDGTPQGTTLFKGDLDRSELYVFGGSLYIVGFRSLFEKEYWKSDGTVEGTTQIEFVPEGVDFLSGFEFNGKFVYAGQNSTGYYNVYITDGTPGGTLMLVEEEALAGYIGAHDQYKAEVNGRLIFVTEFFLWSTDGTPEGTFLLDDGKSLFSSDHLTEFNGKVFFEGSDKNGRRELWVTDGTAEGTEIFEVLSDDPQLYSSRPEGFMEYCGKLFFWASPAFGQEKIYMTDGTPEGTQLFSDIPPEFWEGRKFTLVNGELFFVGELVVQDDGGDDLNIAGLYKISSESDCPSKPGECADFREFCSVAKPCCSADLRCAGVCRRKVTDDPTTALTPRRAVAPTNKPSMVDIMTPTGAPSKQDGFIPTTQPSPRAPSLPPTGSPTALPTQDMTTLSPATAGPTAVPSSELTSAPTSAPPMNGQSGSVVLGGRPFAFIHSVFALVVML